MSKAGKHVQQRRARHRRVSQGWRRGGNEATNTGWLLACIGEGEAKNTVRNLVCERATPDAPLPSPPPPVVCVCVCARSHVPT